MTNQAISNRDRAGSVRTAATGSVFLFRFLIPGGFAAAVLALDLLFPLGVAGGVPYVGLVLLGLSSPRKSDVFHLAAVGSALTIIGYFMSPTGGVEWMVLANRILALVVIWITAALCYRENSAVERLESSHNDLEETVARRTLELRKINDSLNREVTERKGVQQELEKTHRFLEREIETRSRELSESAALLNSITDNLPVMISYVGLDRRFRVVNKAYETWFGRKQDDICGRHMREVLGEAAYQRVNGSVEKALSGEITEFEAVIPNCENEQRQVSATYVPQRGNGGAVIGFTALVRDVTERRQSEERLRQAQKLEAVGQLTGGVAHEFNNLLHAAGGFLDILGDEIGDNERSRNLLDRAQNAIFRGAEITNSLLAYGRKQTLQPRNIDLKNIIHGLAPIINSTLGATIEFEMVLQDDLWQAKADPSQVEQVIINLILNARDALPDGGKVSIETANVHFGGDYFPEQLPGFFAGKQNINSGDYVTVVVTDNGTGISPEDVEHIFEPFFSTKDVGTGTGLGLSMVYGFAQQSDGFIHIDTEMGRGTRMKFGLPKALTEDVKR